MSLFRIPLIKGTPFLDETILADMRGRYTSVYIRTAFDVENAGRYDVRAAFAEGVDCGIFDMYVGKKKANGKNKKK